MAAKKQAKQAARPAAKQETKPAPAAKKETVLVPAGQEPEYEENPFAPHIVFDHTVSSTLIDGALQITLAAKSLTRDRTSKAGIKSKPVAHLRMTPFAAQELHKGLQECFRLIAQAQALVREKGESSSVN